MDFFKHCQSEEVYWALLLEPIDETRTKFKRVGLGMMYPRAWEKVKGTVTTCEIV
jgi:hypothetical protein